MKQGKKKKKREKKTAFSLSSSGRLRSCCCAFAAPCSCCLESLTIYEMKYLNGEGTSAPYLLYESRSKFRPEGTLLYPTSLTLHLELKHLSTYLSTHPLHPSLPPLPLLLHNLPSSLFLLPGVGILFHSSRLSLLVVSPTASSSPPFQTTLLGSAQARLPSFWANIVPPCHRLSPSQFASSIACHSSGSPSSFRRPSSATIKASRY